MWTLIIPQAYGCDMLKRKLLGPSNPEPMWRLYMWLADVWANGTKACCQGNHVRDAESKYWQEEQKRGSLNQGGAKALDRTHLRKKYARWLQLEIVLVRSGWGPRKETVVQG
jgi:hypothetical protein